MDFIINLFGSAGLMTVIGWPILKTIIDNRLARDLAELNSRLREVEEINREKIQTERNRKELEKKYTRILLLSASNLQDRLWHLCSKQFIAKNKVLLADDEDVPMYGSWPMTKKHYLISTVYFFARYFCWVEILRDHEQFIELKDKTGTHNFDYHLKRIERMLAETSLQKMSINKISIDRPIFQLMQTEIGQSMRVDKDGEDCCLTFYEFRSNYDSLIAKVEGLENLQTLLTQSMSGAKSNFCQTRLRLLCNALLDQIEFFYEFSGLAASDSIERLEVLDFDNDIYLKSWPDKKPH